MMRTRRRHDAVAVARIDHRRWMEVDPVLVVGSNYLLSQPVLGGSEYGRMMCPMKLRVRPRHVPLLTDSAYCCCCCSICSSPETRGRLAPRMAVWGTSSGRGCACQESGGTRSRARASTRT